MPPLSQRTLPPAWGLDHQKRTAKTNKKEVPSPQLNDSSSLPPIPLRKTSRTPRDPTRTCCPLSLQEKEVLPNEMGEKRFQGLRKRKNRTLHGHSSRKTGKADRRVCVASAKGNDQRNRMLL